MTTVENHVGVSAIAAKVIANVQAALTKSPTGVCFCAVNNYTAQTGEVTNRRMNIGIKYENQKTKDVKTLQSLDMIKAKEKFGFKSSLVMLETARTALINGFLKPDENRSMGQINAYTTINGALKVHNETGFLYIWGYTVKKEVKVKGVYKEVKSAELTIAKNELRKILRTNKFCNMSLAIGNNITVNGDTLEITM